MKALKLYWLVVCGALISSGALAQGDKVKFNAVSRTLQQTSQLSEDDTVSLDRMSNGHTLIDFGLNINPDRNTEIQTIFRFRTELGGFFGDGTEVGVRQIRIKGLVRNIIGYEVGDIYLKLSPYTLYNNDADGMINEATIFSDLRNDIAQYENLNRDNFWWQQGGHADFGLQFDKIIHTLKVDGFFLRNRGTDFLEIPSTFYAGGRVAIKKNKDLGLSLNYINMYDDGATVGSEASVQNPVASAELNYRLVNENFVVEFAAEAGMSQLNYKPETSEDTSEVIVDPEDYSDNFFDVGAVWKSKKNGLQISAGYRVVGANFYSAGAQTKRVNFNYNPEIFGTVNNGMTRGLTLFDLTRDATVYTPVITRNLMAYDPRLSNVLPYGMATPNRQGLTFGVAYKTKNEAVAVNVKGMRGSEVAAISSPNTRNFLLARVSGDVSIAKLLDWKKSFLVNFGLQYENTTRDGNIVAVDLTSSLIDFGIDLEFYKNLELLVGIKMLSSKGNEFILLRNEFNVIDEITSTTSVDIDQTETLLAFGLKYNFNERIYMTGQYHLFNFEDKISQIESPEYGFNQVFLLFNMKL